MGHVVDHGVEGDGVAGHFQADVEAFLHADLALDVGEFFFGNINGARRAHTGGEGEAVGVDVGDDDFSCARLPRDGGGHATDRAGAGDEHVFADEVVLERGVRGVAERVEAGKYVEWDRGVDMDGIARGDAEVFGERAVAIHAHAFGVFAKVAAAGEAVAAEAADDVALAVDEIAGLKANNISPDGGDGADELMADDHRRLDRFLGPSVPVINVNIGPADGGFFDLD